MGNLCVPSKEPKSEDRQRLYDADDTAGGDYGTHGNGGEADAAAAAAASHSTPIGVPGSRIAASADPNMSRSYTEARLEEEGFFQSIVKRTENDLLNAHDDADTLGPVHDASQLSRFLAAHDRTTVGAAALPSSSVEPDELAATLNAPAVTIKDTAWLVDALGQVSTALTEIQIQHKADVVVSLGDPIL
mmetsp:Transcript_10708/g.27552  ORF Transcript_10708/g.27552 Transcript_10708/m.27552 type:complete len:189 (+) Transcript_10708:291-857(+)